MTNVTMSVKGNVLTVTIDLSKKGTTSATGKSEVIASTHGNVEIPGKPGVYAGINIYKKK